MVDFSEFSYVPIVDVRLSEMTAMEELAPAVKDVLLPHITLQPWLSAHHIEPVIAKVGAAVGHRPVIIDVTREPFDFETRKPVHDAFDSLRDSTDGYRNLFEFIEEHENFVPSLQLAARRELPRQIQRAAALGRGIVIKLTEQVFGASVEIAERLRRIDQEKIYFILDYQHQSRELLTRTAGAIGYVEGIRAVLPNCYISVSASTFPSTFGGRDHQTIFERQFHDAIVGRIGAGRIIYSDRASVRERQSGGGGSPAPRIDNATQQEWTFFREDNDSIDRDVRYQRAASRAMRSESWIDLGIWGTTQIINTANGGAAIVSPQRSTAARINIHVHQQANFGALPAPDTESDWTD